MAGDKRGIRFNYEGEIAMAITQEEKDILTQRISEVKAMLDNLVRAAPHDRDTLKTACQICNLFQKDKEIPPRWCDGSYLHLFNILGVKM